MRVQLAGVNTMDSGLLQRNARLSCVPLDGNITKNIDQLLFATIFLFFYFGLIYFPTKSSNTVLNGFTNDKSERDETKNRIPTKLVIGLEIPKHEICTCRGLSKLKKKKWERVSEREKKEI